MNGTVTTRKWPGNSWRRAGYADGFFTSIQVPHGASQTWRDPAVWIAEMLADVAIDAEVVESDFYAPAEQGIKLMTVRRFGQDIDRFFIEHFGAGGEYNYSWTRLDSPLPGPNDLNSIIGLHQELVEQVYYIPLPAPPSTPEAKVCAARCGPNYMTLARP